jgi:hypothetical protein
VSGGRNTRSGCSVSGGNDLLRVEEVDSEETDRVKGDENKGEYDGDVGRDEVVFGDLGSANRETELEVSEALTLPEKNSPCMCSFHSRQS